MTDRELMQMALDALEHLQTDIEWQYKSPTRAMLRKVEKALRARLAQPEPEPVAWRGVNWSGSPDNYAYRDYDDPLLNIKGENVGEPLYTAPPQRIWQGLTDDEIDDIWAEFNDGYSIIEETLWGYERAIEAKLREKNA